MSYCGVAKANKTSISKMFGAESKVDIYTNRW